MITNKDLYSKISVTNNKAYIYTEQYAANEVEIDLTNGAISYKGQSFDKAVEEVEKLQTIHPITSVLVGSSMIILNHGEFEVSFDKLDSNIVYGIYLNSYKRCSLLQEGILKFGRNWSKIFEHKATWVKVDGDWMFLDLKTLFPLTSIIEVEDKYLITDSDPIIASFGCFDWLSKAKNIIEAKYFMYDIF
jgi:hypothetical protein